MRKPPLIFRWGVLTISLLLALAFLGYRAGAFDRWLRKEKPAGEFDGIRTKIMGGSKSDGGL